MAEVIERGRTEQVGVAAEPLLGQLTIVTDTSALATSVSRLDNQQLAELRIAANLPLPAAGPPCDPDYLTKCLRSFSILARRRDDAVTGELRASLLEKVLGKYDRDSINFLLAEVLKTCHFFPTPAECLAILGRHDGPVERARKERASAAARIRREMQQRYVDWLTQLRRGDLTQAEVDAAPPHWCAVGETQGLLRKTDTGSFVLRGKAREAA